MHTSPTAEFGDESHLPLYRFILQDAAEFRRRKKRIAIALLVCYDRGCMECMEEQEALSRQMTEIVVISSAQFVLYHVVLVALHCHWGRQSSDHQLVFLPADTYQIPPVGGAYHGHGCSNGRPRKGEQMRHGHGCKRKQRTLFVPGLH